MGYGQLINPTKCSVLFSYSCPQDTQNSIKTILEVDQITFEEKYVGLPIPKGRMKSTRFQPIKERLRKRLTVLSEKFMSMAAKETLIKSVAQALPILVMRDIKILAGFHEDYMKMIRKFCWGEDEKKVQ